jgi:hypothetical protein
MEKKTNKWKWALLLGGTAAAALLWGCLNTVSWGTGGGVADQGPTNPDRLSPAAPETGIAAEEFIVTLGIGGEGPEASRSVLGPGAGGIQYGGIRNIVQVIVVNAGTGDVTYFQQEVRESDSDPSAALTVEGIWPGQRYHILVLTGHRERDYANEGSGDYLYFDGTGSRADRLPTLLAAGLLADREIKSGEKTLSITMKPLTVDTVFAHEKGVIQAALGGTTLPAGAASIVWTLTGGIETLRDAQTGLPGGGIGLNWGNPFIPHDAILNNWNGGGSPAIVLDHNQITLDLGTQAAKVFGSANFNLEYLPFGADNMDSFVGFNSDAASWIIRNGVNDTAQNAKTVFPNTVSTVSPWNDKAVGESDAKNGNGAVAFTFANPEITHIDLADLFPVPVTGAKPVGGASIDGGTYTGTVTWNADPMLFFKGETIYSATVTNLKEKDGFQFSPDGFTVTHSGSSQIAYAPDGKVGIIFLKTGAVWEYNGSFSGSSAAGGEMDSAIDIIRQAKKEGWSSLSLKLFPWQEKVDLGAQDTDIGAGLELTAATNSPAAVTIDGGGKTIPLETGNTGSVITVGNGVTLTLRNITFKGSDANNAPLIKVENGGKLVLENGAVITGNKNTSGGGGVSVSGALVMNGGTISGNITTSGNDNTGGGGVYVSGGSFTMKNGEISKNTAGKWGGGVLMVGSSEFTMSGGSISGNETGGQSNGGGVMLYGSGGFTMSGGTISDNKATQRGGGVALYSQSKFTMNGGIISGNKTTQSNTGYGGGVYVADTYCTFIKKPADGGPLTSGVIYGNDAAPSLQNTALMQGQAVGVGTNKGWNKTADENTELDSSNTSGSGWES